MPNKTITKIAALRRSTREETSHGVVKLESGEALRVDKLEKLEQLGSKFKPQEVIQFH